MATASVRRAQVADDAPFFRNRDLGSRFEPLLVSKYRNHIFENGKPFNAFGFGTIYSRFDLGQSYNYFKNLQSYIFWGIRIWDCGNYELFPKEASHEWYPTPYCIYCYWCTSWTICFPNDGES
ncbi:NADH dehydrogenase [ubiquinone] 1 subunit C2 [Daphnia magna]|uniref:NADH dehydrogenase [ubiquinone] 1 subunit C2 n=1 Tax=Daphnia magna TaxID=35525 RepID=A0A164R3I8_9CRUS|nr:NADH dehydrogenase [ubiquinone] 1 subunit C2 [Daphnia magna]